MKPTTRRVLALIGLALLAALWLVPVFAFAQAAAPATGNTGQDLGVIGLMATVIGLLVQLTKVGAVNAIIPSWLRPFVALGLGVVAGAIDQVIRGDSWSKAIIGGIIAAATAVFGNQLGAGVTPGGRAKKEAASAVAHALEGPTSEVQAKIEVLRRDLGAVAAKPDKTERLKALAEAATRASNGVT